MHQLGRRRRVRSAIAATIPTTTITPPTHRALATGEAEPARLLLASSGSAGAPPLGGGAAVGEPVAAGDGPPAPVVGTTGRGGGGESSEAPPTGWPCFHSLPETVSG